MKALKIIVGVLIWTFGSILFAWLAHYAPDGAGRNPSGPEFIYAAMSFAYFCVVPFLIAFWVNE